MYYITFISTVECFFFYCSKMCCRNTIICEKCFRSRIDLIFICSTSRTFFNFIFILNVFRLCEKVSQKSDKMSKKYYKFLNLMLMYKRTRLIYYGVITSFCYIRWVGKSLRHYYLVFWLFSGLGNLCEIFQSKSVYHCYRNDTWNFPCNYLSECEKI